MQIYRGKMVDNVNGNTEFVLATVESDDRSMSILPGFSKIYINKKYPWSGQPGDNFFIFFPRYIC
jgi:hypothetical protein